jgi:predicted nucleic acid-binding protein
VSVVVVDASVAAKWMLPSSKEPLASEALTLLSRYVKGEIRFIVPDLFWAECGSILWKAVRQGRLTKYAAGTALESLRDRNFPAVSSWSLLDAAFEIASIFDRTVYDSLYVALAVNSNGEFVTADERLANALAARFPVKWLGAV